jgi:hypothetical protein
MFQVILVQKMYDIPLNRTSVRVNYGFCYQGHGDRTNGQEVVANVAVAGFVGLGGLIA